MGYAGTKKTPLFGAGFNAVQGSVFVVGSFDLQFSCSGFWSYAVANMAKT